MALNPDPALTNGTTDATTAPQPTPAQPQAGLPGSSASAAITPAASAPAQVTQPQAAAIAAKSAPTPSMDDTINAASTGKGATGILRGILVGALKGASAHIASAGKAVGSEGATFLKAQPAYQARVVQQQDMQLKQQANARENQTAMSAQDEAKLRIVLGNLTAHKLMLENQAEQTKQDAEQNQLSQDYMGFLNEAGVPYKDSHGAGHDNLTAQDGKDAGNGSVMNLSNGQAGDKAGVVLVNTAYMQRTPSPKPYSFPTEYKVNEKGDVVPVPESVQTIPAGAPLIDSYNAHMHSQKLLSDAQAAQDKNVERQTKQADLAKKQTENADTLTQLETKPEMMAGEKAPSIIAAAQSHATDPNTSPTDKARWARIGAQATQTLKVQEQAKANQARVAEAAKDGDPASMAQFLVSGSVAPSQIISNRKPEFASAAIQAAQKLDPNWKASTAETEFKAANNPSNVAFFQNVGSLLDAGGTLDQLARAGAALPQGNLPPLNTIADWEKAKTGDGAIAGFAATALGVADDYAKVMGGGAGTDSARHEALNIIAANQSPDQRAKAIAAIRDAVTSQGKSRIGNNRAMANVYGGHFAPSAAKAQQNAQKKNPF